MDKMNLFLQRVQEGLSVDGLKVVALETRHGRFAEEMYIALAVIRGEERSPLADAILFRGRPPHYRAWIEIFAQRPTIHIGREVIRFFDSAVERTLLAEASAALGPGDAIFVDCEADEETLTAMRWGVPDAITRLGFLLFRLGFTWFKPWYYPEGFREGGQKLQAEKPLDPAARARHVRAVQEDVRRFLAQADRLPDHPVVARALERGRLVLAATQVR